MRVALGRALYAPVPDNRALAGNIARFHFLDPRSEEFFPDAMQVSGPGQAALTLTAYTAEPGSPSADALAMLASWAATHAAL